MKHPNCSKIFSRLLAITLTVLCLTGCLRKNIGSLDQVVATAADRAGTLEPMVQNYHKGIYWQAYGDVAALIDPQVRASILPTIQEDRQSVNYVDWKIKKLDFNDDSTAADVSVSVRYYKTPRYIVDTRVEREHWTYHRLEGGWLCDSHEIEE